MDLLEAHSPARHREAVKRVVEDPIVKGDARALVALLERDEQRSARRCERDAASSETQSTTGRRTDQRR